MSIKAETKGTCKILMDVGGQKLLEDVSKIISDLEAEIGLQALKNLWVNEQQEDETEWAHSAKTVAEIIREKLGQAPISPKLLLKK